MFGNRQSKKMKNDDQTWQLIDELHALSKSRAVTPSLPTGERPANLSDPDQSTDALIESLHQLAMAQKPATQQSTPAPEKSSPAAELPPANMSMPADISNADTHTDNDIAMSDIENKDGKFSASIDKISTQTDTPAPSAELDDDLSLIEDIKLDSPNTSAANDEIVTAKINPPQFGMGIDKMPAPASDDENASAISPEQDDDIIASIGAMDIDDAADTYPPAHQSVPSVPPMPPVPTESVLTSAQADDSPVEPADPDSTQEPELSVLDDAANIANADAIRRMVEGNLNEDDIEWLKNGFDSDVSRSQLEAGLTGEIANQIKPYLNQLEPHIVEAVENLLEGEFSGDVKKILDEQDAGDKASKKAE